MTEQEKIDLGVQKYLNLEGNVTKIASELKIKSNLITKRLNDLGYILRGGATAQQVINLKNAVDEFIERLDEGINVGYFAKKHNCARITLSKRLKALGYDIVNYQTMLKFDETIFDSIDTEEKAYWLGFLYADGYVSSNSNKFELSLQDSDSEHLEKFNTFMKCITPNKVKHGTVTCEGKTYYRCRWSVNNKHLKERLCELGCVPNKSLILTFPDESIFASKDLIRHFIRGYWDGDGSLSWSNKEHTYPCMVLLGTESFLNSVMNYLNFPKYKLQSKSESGVRQFSIGHKIAFNTAKYLYENATIYLTRKYEKYLEYCRLYEKSNRGLQTNIGESCDANTEISIDSNESIPS